MAHTFNNRKATFGPITKILASALVLCVFLMSMGCGADDMQDGFAYDADPESQELAAQALPGCDYSTYEGCIMIPDQGSKGKRVIIVKSDKAKIAESDVLWEWKVNISGWGVKMSDVKRVSYAGSDHILVTGSSGALALVKVSSKNVVYWNTPGGSPHASALLPGGLIASADPRLAQLRIFDISRGNNRGPAQQFSHAGCHSVVWDKNNARIWSWGGKAMKEYKITNGKVEFVKSYSGGSGGGHGLAPLTGTNQLLFTHKLGIGTFNLDRKAFDSDFAKVGNGLKGVDYNPKTGEIIWMKGGGVGVDSRSNRIQSVEGPTRTMTGGVWYRARFYVNN